MPQVFLSIGSNVDRERHIRSALDALHDQFGELLISPVYESAAVGFAGAAFYNLVVGFETDLGVVAVLEILRGIEAANQRRRDGPKFSDRTLDIDILLYGAFSGVVAGAVLPRPEITEQAYVLRPLADIAATARLPPDGKSYADLWANYPKAGDRQLRRVDFRWQSPSP